jgi:hypothetical protein
MVDIVFKRILNDLSYKRPIFYSEADFQHSIAWYLHLLFPDSNLRLEKRVVVAEEAFYVDIVFINSDSEIPIEVKYKTRAISAKIDNEIFQLKSHGAQDLGRYDFIKDIVRVEKVVASTGKGKVGYVLFLTNDSAYWKESNWQRETVYKEFEINDGRILKGKLSWKDHVGPGTTRGREQPLTLMGNYKLEWKEYSDLNSTYGKFRYLIVEIKDL